MRPQREPGPYDSLRSGFTAEHKPRSHGLWVREVRTDLVGPLVLPQQFDSAHLEHEATLLEVKTTVRVQLVVADAAPHKSAFALWPGTIDRLDARAICVESKELHVLGTLNGEAARPD